MLNKVLNNKFSIALIIFVFIMIPTFTFAANSTMVYIGSDEILHYNTYANQGESNSDNILPDFSYSGYKGGGVEIPDIEVKITVNPVEGDNTQSIQNAIDYVSSLTPDANGFRGAVYLNPGYYNCEGSLYINTSGVVLRGAGQGSDASVNTILYNNQKIQNDFLVVSGSPYTYKQEAENCSDHSTGVVFENGNSGTVAQLGDGDWIKFDDINLNGVNYIVPLNIETTLPGKFEIYIDSITGTFIGSNNINPTFGTHDVFVKFVGNTTSSVTHVDWVSFFRAWNMDTDIHQSINGNVPVGSKQIPLQSVTQFAVGDKIVVMFTPNEDWITYIGCDDATIGWKSYDFNTGYERTITAIDTGNNVITVDTPVVQAITSAYGGGIVFKYDSIDRVKNVGIENLRIDSYYASDTDELHGWRAVKLNYVEDSWLRGITSIHYGFTTVELYDSCTRITVEDCAYLEPKSVITGSRRYGFTMDKSVSCCLIQRCYSSEARHDFATNRHIPGPNVFLDCYGENSYADSAPHQQYATGILYDNVRATMLGASMRTDSSNVPNRAGWGGAQFVFWNCEAGHGKSNYGFVRDGTVTIESPNGGKNFGIGCKGLWNSGYASDIYPGTGFTESYGTNVDPRSLYLQQLKDRLGQSAVDSITIAAQRDGKILDELSAWKGEGSLYDSTKANRLIYTESFDSWLSQEDIDTETEYNRVTKTYVPKWENKDPIPLEWYYSMLGGTVKVVDEPSDSDQSLKLEDINADAVSAARYFSTQSDVMITEFRAKFSAADKIAYMKLRKNSNDIIGIRSYSNGMLQYCTGGSNYSDIQSYTSNTWYDFKIVADIITDTYDIYINGDLKASGLNFPASTDSLDNIMFATHSTSSGYSISVDNINITADNLRSGVAYNFDNSDTGSVYHKNNIRASDSFDNYVTGSEPTGWSIIDTGGSASVQENPDAADKSLMLNDTSTTDYVKATLSFDAASTIVVADFKTLMDTTNPGYYRYITLNDITTEIIKLRTIRLVNEYNIEKAYVEYYDGSQYRMLGSVSINLTTNPSRDPWYRFRVVANTGTDKFNVYVNGKQIGFNKSFINPVSSLNSISFSTDVSASGFSDYYNDLSVTRYWSYTDTNTARILPLGWNCNEAGGKVMITDTPSSTDKSMRLYDTSATDSSSATKSFGSETVPVTVQADIMSDCNNSLSYFILRGNNNTTDTVIIKADSDGNLKYNINGSYTTIQSYSPNTWYTIKIVTDPSTDKCDIYVNDIKKLDQVSFSNPVTNISSLKFVTHSTNGTAEYSLYVNNVSVIK